MYYNINYNIINNTTSLQHSKIHHNLNPVFLEARYRAAPMYTFKLNYGIFSDFSSILQGFEDVPHQKALHFNKQSYKLQCKAVLQHLTFLHQNTVLVPTRHFHFTVVPPEPIPFLVKLTTLSKAMKWLKPRIKRRKLILMLSQFVRRKLTVLLFSAVVSQSCIPSTVCEDSVNQQRLY